MNWKIVFFDLDGTLLDKNFHLSEEIISGIKKIRSLGIRVSIATGRSQESAKKFIDLLEIKEDIVVHNGAVILDINGKIKTIGTIDKNIISDLVEFHSKTPLSFKLHFPDCRIIKSTKKPWQGEGKHFVEGEVIENLQGIALKNVVKVVFFESEQKIEAFKNFIRFPSKVKFLRSHLNHIEILPCNISKAEGIQEILKKENFVIDKVIAIGDNENDIEMLKQVGLGISVGEELVELKKISDYHFPLLFKGGMKKLIDFLREQK